MTERQPSRKATTTRVWLIALYLLIGVAGLACTGVSSDNDDILGTWKGSIQIAADESEVSITLEVKQDKADLDYGPRRNCQAAAEHIRSEDKVHIYNIVVEQGGSLMGWCKKLRGGTMKLTSNKDGTLYLHMINKDKQIDESADLNK